MSQLRVLNLSKNKLISLGSITQGLQALEELWVRDNQLAHLSTLQQLANCPSLARLALKPNPVCKLGQAGGSKVSGEPPYWHVVVAHAAQLQILDGVSIGPAHRASASGYLASAEGRQMLRSLGYDASMGLRSRHDRALLAAPPSGAAAPPSGASGASGAENAAREGGSEEFAADAPRSVVSGGDIAQGRRLERQ